MNKNIKRFSITTFVVVVLLLLAGTAYAVTNFVRPQSEGTVIPYTFFSATSTAATSTNDGTGRYLNITGAKKVEILFTHGGVTHINTGTSTFLVQGTIDGSTWFTINKLVQNLATSTTPTTLSSVQIPISGPPATSTTAVSLDLKHDAFIGLRCLVYESTPGSDVDGEHTCSAIAEY